MRRTSALTLLAVLTALSTGVSAGDDDFVAMLGYLTSRHPDGHALRGAGGSAAVNAPADDLNRQADLRAFAIATDARAWVDARQRTPGSRADALPEAQASITADAHGLASIGHARCPANTQLDAAATAPAGLGIRETMSGALPATDPASAEMRARAGVPGAGPRSVSAAAGATPGFRGVPRLDPAPGSGNATGNILSLSVSELPR